VAEKGARPAASGSRHTPARSSRWRWTRQETGKRAGPTASDRSQCPQKPSRPSADPTQTKKNRPDVARSLPVAFGSFAVAGVSIRRKKWATRRVGVVPRRPWEASCPRRVPLAPKEILSSRRGLASRRPREASHSRRVPRVRERTHPRDTGRVPTPTGGFAFAAGALRPEKRDFLAARVASRRSREASCLRRVP
jgi:hypothetical protein